MQVVSSPPPDHKRATKKNSDKGNSMQGQCPVV